MLRDLMVSDEGNAASDVFMRNHVKKISSELEQDHVGHWADFEG